MTSLKDEVEFYGHPMVTSRHPTTIEVTKDEHLTINGDCIIGVRADKGLSELSSGLRELIMADGTRLLITIEVPPEKFVVKAVGSRELTLESSAEMVIRKSAFISPRTLALNADAAAKDIPRTMTGRLRDPGCRGVLRIEAVN